MHAAREVGYHRGDMKTPCWALIGILPVIGMACKKAPPAPDLLRPATIKDIMDSMVDPSGEYVFASIQEIADEHGITEKAPKTDGDWDEVRHRLYILLEAPNLLTMEGRKVRRAPKITPEIPRLKMSRSKCRSCWTPIARLSFAGREGCRTRPRWESRRLTRKIRMRCFKRSTASTRLAKAAICTIGIRTTREPRMPRRRTGSPTTESSAGLDIYFARPLGPCAITGNL